MSLILESFIESYEQPVKNLVIKADNLIRNTIPDTKVQFDLPAKLMAYAYGPGYKDTICTIILSKNEIKLGLYKGANLPDPANLLQGAGKVHKHIPIKSEEDLHNPSIKTLLKEAHSAYLKRKENHK